MTTLQPLHGSAAESFAYFGARDGWLIALQVNRDSDAIDRSNWDVIVPEMLAAHPDDSAIERMNHWAVGWVDYLLVRPDSPAAVAAQSWADKLADYPLADEEHFSALEWSEEWCVRCDRGTRGDHDSDNRNGAPIFRTCMRFRSEEDARDICDRWKYRPLGLG